MKEIRFFSMLFLGLLLVAVCLSYAEETQSISVTVSLESEISVSLDKTAWNIGAISLNSVTGPEVFVATVGNSDTILEIMGGDGAGGWQLGSSAGIDTFAVPVEWQDTGELGLSNVFQEMLPAVSAYGTRTFNLTYQAPTQDTQGGGKAQNFTVTLKASLAP